MSTTDRSVRQSVTLPSRVARRVRSLAKSRRTSVSRVLTELIESGLRAVDRERDRFLECVERLARSRNPAERARLEEELARLTFGD